MYKRYSVLLIVLALAFSGYGVYWFIAADRAETALPKTLARVLPEGLSIKYSQARRSGFPFRIIFTVNDLEITGDGGNRLETGQAEAVMQPTNPDHLIFRFAQPIRYSIADGNDGRYEGLVEAERFLASAVSLGKDKGFRLDLDARGLRIERRGQKAMVAKRAQVHLRPTRKEGIYEVVLSGHEVVWDGFQLSSARSTGTLVYRPDETGARPRLRINGLDTASDASAPAEGKLKDFLDSF